MVKWFVRPELKPQKTKCFFFCASHEVDNRSDAINQGCLLNKEQQQNTLLSSSSCKITLSVQQLHHRDG